MPRGTRLSQDELADLFGDPEEDREDDLFAVAEDGTDGLPRGWYDPRKDGALCDICPLKKRWKSGTRPVKCETHPHDEAIALDKCPGHDENEVGRPYVGNTGKEWDRTLQAVGLSRQQIAITNVISCMPPASDYDAMMGQIRARNRRAKKRGAHPDELDPYPADCCRPRLLKDLGRHRNVIVLGGVALTAITGAKGILRKRGILFDKTVVDGDPRELRRRVLPTVSPAFALRRRGYIRYMRDDVKRGWAWFRDEVAWADPAMYGCEITTDEQTKGRLQPPSPREVIDFVKSMPRFVSYDVETDGIDALRCNLRCVAFGTRERVMVVPLLSRDGVHRFYPAPVEAEVRKVLKAFFTDPRWVKQGWNSGYFDRLVMEQHFGVTPAPHRDGILMHRVCEPEMPHTLQFAGSTRSVVMDWKGGAEAKDEKVSLKADHECDLCGKHLVAGGLAFRVQGIDGQGDGLICTACADNRLAVYCCRDVAVTHEVIGTLGPEVQERKQTRALRVDHQRQAMCTSLRRNGTAVDQRRRLYHEKRLRAQALEHATKCIELATLLGAEKAIRDNFGLFDDAADEAVRELYAGAGRESEEAGTMSDAAFMDAIGVDRAGGITLFNPNSPVQVRELLFRTLKVQVPDQLSPKDAYTPTGDPSTGDAVMRALVLDQYLNPKIRDLVHHMRLYRKATKKLGTFIRPYRFEPGAKGCRIDPDGRVRSTWNAHTTSVRRLSSSGPNMQNLTYDIRDIFIPGAGHAFVYADYDQLHLRIAASLWQLADLLEVFARGGDPHAEFAALLYQKKWASIHPKKVWSEKDGEHKWVKAAKTLRDLAKRIRYAGLYMAQAKTIHRELTSVENDAGELIYAHITLRQVRLLIERWYKSEPELPKAWDRILADWREQGYIEEPLLGFRRDFVDSQGREEGQEDVNEIINAEILTTEASILGIVEKDLIDAIPFFKWGPGTGMINQMHDSVHFEVPIAEAERLKGLVTEVMTRRFPELPGVVFSADASVRRHL